MDQDSDMLLGALSRLPMIPPDQEWEAVVLERCHAALGMCVARRERAKKDSIGARLIDLAAVAALGVYFVAVLTAAARLVGSL